MMGKGTVQAQGSMAVPVEVTGWDACVPQRLRLDLPCDIMSAPAKIVLGYLTCKDLGLLMVAVQDFAVAWHTRGLWYQQMGRWNAQWDCVVKSARHLCTATKNQSVAERN